MQSIFARFVASVAGGLMLSLCAPGASAAVINFQDHVTGSGPAFCGAGNAQTLTITMGVYDVVFSGGAALGPGILNLPATASVAYGTSDFANGCDSQSGYTNPLTIQFFATGTSTALNVNNFFVDLYNGNTVAVDYTLTDNLSNSATFNVGQNLAGGQHTFGFASAGSAFTITGGVADGGCCAWDFFINNVGFNEDLPTGSTVPEPATLGLTGLALLGMYGARRQAKSLAARKARPGH